ncbi:hypothetical protein GF420_06905 [candidate division GN15 bacterium]|nr:hypothetical protein [candidate division GN15 bacterium]
MLYLFLAIICSSSIALIFKHSETAGMNRYAVTSTNYLAACLVSALLIAIRGAPPFGQVSVVDGLAVVREAIASGGGVTSISGGIVWAALVGLGAGAFFFLAFIYYQISVRNEGVGLSGAFAKLGILVPMSLSLLFWREFPTGVQWLGIAVAVFSIVLVNWPTRKAAVTLRLSLILLFLFAGLAEFSNKIFQKYALLEYKDLFLLVNFFVALVLSLLVTWYQRLPVRRRDLLTGIAVGVPNLFSSYFLILALDQIPAAVAFPAFGAGTILIINVAGALVFKERLSRRDRVVVALVALSLILINL